MQKENKIVPEPLTIAKFASELGISDELLLSKIRKSGLDKTSIKDIISDSDKQTFLHYLRTGKLSQPTFQEIDTYKEAASLNNLEQVSKPTGSKSSKKFQRTLQQLLRQKIPPDYEQWRDLAITALKMAYSNANCEYANQLLKYAPTDDLAWSIFEWLKELGVDVRVRETDGTELKAYGVIDRSAQSKVFMRCNNHPLEIRRSTINRSQPKRKDYWLDDLELENRSHSVRAFQGGRASGK